LAYRSNLGAYKLLAKRHATVVAKVVSPECWDHGRVDYQYIVRAQTYSGSTNRVDKPCAETSIGESILVNYDPNFPAVNSADDPRLEYTGRRRSLAIYLIAIALFVGVSLVRWASQVRRFNARSQEFAASNHGH
jgi:hypothetical protein